MREKAKSAISVCMAIIMVLAIILLLPAPRVKAVALKIYVDANAPAGGDGSQANPFQKLTGNDGAIAAITNDGGSNDFDVYILSDLTESLSGVPDSRLRTGKTVTINLGGHTVSLTHNAVVLGAYANTTVNIVGTGTLQLTHNDGGSVLDVRDGSTFTIAAGVRADMTVQSGSSSMQAVIADNGSTVTVENGSLNVSGGVAILSRQNSNINFTGDVMYTGTEGTYAVQVTDSSTLTLNGNLTSTQRRGVNATDSTVTINGSITAPGTPPALGGEFNAVNASNNAVVSVSGNISIPNGIGAYALTNGGITVGGNIVAATGAVIYNQD